MLGGERVTQTAQSFEMELDAALNGLGIDGRTMLDISSALVQDIPENDAQFVDDGPNGLLVAEPRQQLSENDLEMAALGAHSSVRDLA